MIETVQALHAALEEFERTADYDREMVDASASFALAEAVQDAIEELRREL